MKALVVEDSRLARNELIASLKKIEKFDDIIEVSNGQDAVVAIRGEKPDVVFLDIHLPGMDGFEVLEQLDFVPPIIFTTAFDQYAIKSFEYNAIDYLMKPIGLDRLRKAVDKLKEHHDMVVKKDTQSEKLSIDQKVFVRDGDRCWFVKIEEIRLFESVGNYTRIHFGKEKPLILKTLSYLESILEDKRYFRANRQQIINVQFVESIATGIGGNLKIKLTTGEEVSVSRRQSVEFKVLFSI